MADCKKCGKKIPSRILINGKKVSTSHRTYCLDCSPVNSKIKRDLGLVDDKKKIGKDCPLCGKHFDYIKNNVCSTCRNRNQRAKNKKEVLEILGCKCCVCGYDKCIDAFDVHHVYKDKKVLDFSWSYHLNLIDLIKETEICVLLCSNCHREVHAGQIEEQILINVLDTRLSQQTLSL